MKKLFGITLIMAVVALSVTLAAVAADVGVKDAALGQYGMLVLKNDGSVWGWGSNAGYPKNLHAAGIIEPDPSPRKVMEDAISIAAGSNAYFAAKSDNSLWAWGMGTLGNGKYTSDPAEPFEVMTGVKAVYAGSWVAGNNYVFVIRTDNSLWGWGSNESGSLAAPFGFEAPGMTDSDKPVKIMDDVRHVAVGGLGHVLAVKTDDTLWTWGDNTYGQLGQGTDKPGSYTPKKIADNVETCAAGVATSLFITKNHKLYGFGDASYHLLNQVGAPTPGAVEVIGGKWDTPRLLLENVISAGIGYMHGAAVDTQGQLYVWGDSESLGIPNLQFGAYSVRKGTLTSVKKVFAHENYSLAIMNDNSVYAWGDNSNGQVGTGTRSKNVAAPVKVGEGGDYHPPVAAVPTSSKVLVNGKPVTFEAYNIGGNNYFKLRDIAIVLSGTEKQFEVAWDGANNAISLTMGNHYTIAGGELAVSANPTSKTAAFTMSKILLNGSEIKLTAYNIGGYNYFKLRDVAAAIDYGVTWDGATNTIGIDTSTGYAVPSGTSTPPVIPPPPASPQIQ